MVTGYDPLLLLGRRQGIFVICDRYCIYYICVIYGMYCMYRIYRIYSIYLNSCAVKRFLVFSEIFLTWKKAFEKAGIDPKDYANKEYNLDDEFVWDNIMHGVTKEFLKREYTKALEETTTLKCSLKCAGCGVNQISSFKFLSKK